MVQEMVDAADGPQPSHVHWRESVCVCVCVCVCVRERVSDGERERDMSRRYVCVCLSQTVVRHMPCCSSFQKIKTTRSDGKVRDPFHANNHTHSPSGHVAQAEN